MNKTFILILLLLSIFTSASAQKSTRYQGTTIKVGANYSTIINKSNLDFKYNYKPGFTAGLGFDWKFTDIIGTSVDVMYSRQGGVVDVSKATTEVANQFKITEYSNYINFPIMANIYLTKALTLKAGIQLSYFLTAGDKIHNSNKNTNSEYDLITSYRTLDVSIPLGLCYVIKHRIVIDLRYNFGLSNIVKESPKFPSYKTVNSFASMTVGFRF